MKIIYTDEYNETIHEEWNVDFVPDIDDIVSINELFIVKQRVWNIKGEYVQVVLNIWSGPERVTETTNNVDVSGEISKINRLLTGINKRQETNDKSVRNLRESFSALKKNINQRSQREKKNGN